MHMLNVLQSVDVLHHHLSPGKRAKVSVIQLSHSTTIKT